MVFFDKAQCLYVILDGKLVHLDGQMSPKCIAKIQIAQDVAHKPYIIKKDKSENFLHVQISMNVVQIHSQVDSGRLSLFSMVELRKGAGITDFQPFFDKKLLLITEDGFVCPYTFNENYSKRLKSPKLVLKAGEQLSKCRISRDDCSLILTSKTDKNRLFQIYNFNIEPESCSITFQSFYANDQLENHFRMYLDDPNFNQHLVRKRQTHVVDLVNTYKQTASEDNGIGDLVDVKLVETNMYTRLFFGDGLNCCLWSLSITDGQFLELRMQIKDFVVRKFGDYEDGSVLGDNGIRFVSLK